MIDFVLLTKKAAPRKKLRAKLPISESLLTARLKARDEKAYELLYDYYAPALLGIIIKIVKSEEEAENLLQDAFVKIWLKIGQYDASRGRLFTWMLNISRNTALNYIRSHHLPEPDSIQNVESWVYSDRTSFEMTELNSIGIREMVQKLDKKLLVIIDLIYYLGYTQQEVAEKLDLPLGTVKTRTRTALQLIREYLKED